MTDPTTTNEIDALLRYLETGHTPHWYDDAKRWQAAITALVAERDALKTRMMALEKELAVDTMAVIAAIKQLDAKAMGLRVSDDTSDIVKRVTQGWAEGSPDVLLGIACKEIEELRKQLAEARGLYLQRNYYRERLERELAAAIKQRDEARREVCELDAEIYGHFGDNDRLVVHRASCMPMDVAKDRGWDCFAQQEGGGA